MCECIEGVGIWLNSITINDQVNVMCAVATPRDKYGKKIASTILMYENKTVCTDE